MGAYCSSVTLPKDDSPMYKLFMERCQIVVPRWQDELSYSAISTVNHYSDLHLIELRALNVLAASCM